MPRININEIDNTLYSVNELTNDNIVYVPGNMPKGEYKNPVLITTLDQFEREFGNYSPDGGHTYNYVKGLLIAGLPVLFRRVVAINQDSDSAATEPDAPDYKIKEATGEFYTTKEITDTPELLVSAITINSNENGTVNGTLTVTSNMKFDGDLNLDFKNAGETVGIVSISNVKVPENVSTSYDFTSINNNALAEYIDTLATEAQQEGGDKYPFNYPVASSTISASIYPEKIVEFNVSEMYGGSYGNGITVSTYVKSDSYFIKVIYNGVILEDERITTKTSEDTDTTLNKRIFDYLNTHTFESVVISMAEGITAENFELPLMNVRLTGGKDISDTDVIEEIPRLYDFIADKYIYDVKFVTGGGYTNPDSTYTPIADAQVKLCETRRDCFAILDVPYGTVRSEVPRFFTNLDTSYAAAFAPWCYTKLPTGEEEWMMPSYLFLYTLGRSIQNGNPVYSAPAGVLKASMPQVIKPEYEIGGDTLDLWQGSNPQAINPLMRLRNYGYVIYGQKTLYNIINKNSARASALQDINVRLAINEIRRTLFNTAIRLTFQSNNQRTWNEFKALVEPTLNSMKSNGGITDYRITMDSTTTTEEDIRNNTIRARVSISVAKSVENFEIDFYIEPQSVVFSDEENARNTVTTY